ncbi:peptide-binding protein [Weissella confusa]|uniref:oligopeptide ABC transporter substrate-binding protein n=1 Tax=Weissella confusa TaxID=1583 RepID=UPI0008FEA300|nr:oligopeptide ABC transporter substrate-binding protein [Weissella confusa]OJF03689.1 peptide-binding protein [Weissella confusa]
MSKAVKWLLGLVVLALAAVAAFFAFGQGGKQAEDKTKVGKLSVAYNNEDKLIKGGDLKVAAVSDSPFDGSYLAPLQDDALTAHLYSPTGVGLFKTDKQFKVVDGGAANLKLDGKAKTATIRLRKDLTWSDGKPVTAKDYEFNYEVLANDAYGSDRWTDALANIEGLQEFHEGKTDKISGITFPDGEDGKKVVVHFKEMTPGMPYSGNGVYLESVLPYHQLKDIKPKELAASKANKSEPLTWGPYKVQKVVAGESMKLVPNKYYYGEKPKLNSITEQVVAPTKIVAALKAHKYDLTLENVSSLYKDIKNIPGYKITGQNGLYLSLKYFNLGHYDADKGVNVTDRDTPLQDKRVRQAMGYALNTDQVIDKFSNGLGQRATSLIPPVFKSVQDKSAKGFPLNLKKANALLDEAGWKKNEKTGYREKDGKELDLVYLARSGQPTSEAVTQNNIQQWKKVGIKVSLYGGRLQDFNTWSKIATSGTDQKWDIMDAAWGLSSEPSQTDLFSKTAPYNFGHFTSDKLTELLNDINSQKAMDPAYRKEAFKKYQEYANDEAFVLPQSFAITYTPVNKRVSGWTLSYDSYDMWAKLGVTSNDLATK